MIPRLPALLLPLALGVSALPATAQTGARAPAEATAPAAGESKNIAENPGAHWYIQTSLYTRHFNPDPDHVNHQRLINIERISGNNSLWGFAAFRNSFGQPTQMIYYGQRWHPFASYPSIHVKVVGGLMHGYKGEYKDKVPFNTSAGISPVILPAIGWSHRQFATELILFGNSGMLWTFGAYLK